MRHVYVAGPLSSPDPDVMLGNVNRAIDVGNQLLDEGLWPYVPHLSYYMHQRQERAYEEWMGLDFAVLNIMDALLLLPGPSKGADREVTWMLQRGRPVFHSVEEVVDWVDRRTLAEGALRGYRDAWTKETP